MKDPDWNRIMGIYRYSCIRCGSFASQVHEKLPRSMGPRSMRIGNRVPLCSSCHAWAHQFGASTAAPALTQYQILFLKNHHPRGYLLGNYF